MKKIARYEYPMSGGYADTVAILEDGTMVWINTQYGTVNTREGMITGAEAAEYVADARVNGKRGHEPKATIRTEAVSTPEWTSERGKTLSEEMDSEDSDY